MLAKGNRKDVTRARERDASLNRRGRNSPEATWIRRALRKLAKATNGVSGGPQLRFTPLHPLYKHSVFQSHLKVTL